VDRFREGALVRAIYGSIPRSVAAFVSHLIFFVSFPMLTLNMLQRDQPVLLTTTNPHTPVRIVGITADHGLLRTIPVRRAAFDPWTSRSGETDYIDLMPDGNSFDIMAGLIKTKT